MSSRPIDLAIRWINVYEHHTPEYSLSCGNRLFGFSGNAALWGSSRPGNMDEPRTFEGFRQKQPAIINVIQLFGSGTNK